MEIVPLLSDQKYVEKVKTQITSMIGKLLKAAEDNANERKSQKIASLSDPVASKISWEPASKAGSSMKTHRIVKVGIDRMDFVPTFGTKITLILIIAVGVSLGVVSFFIWRTEILPYVIASAFVGVGTWCLLKLLRPIVFDKGNGMFRIGRATQRLRADSTSKNQARLNAIYAIQLLSKYTKSSGSDGRSGGFTSFELNLILRDGERINVVDHGDLEALQEDAATLATFLDVPVWDVARDPSTMVEDFKSELR